MPVIYSLDEGERVVYLTTVGEPSFDEWRDTLLAVFSDPFFETGFNFISDRRRAMTPSPPRMILRTRQRFSIVSPIVHSALISHASPVAS